VKDCFQKFSCSVGLQQKRSILRNVRRRATGYHYDLDMRKLALRILGEQVFNKPDGPRCNRSDDRKSARSVGIGVHDDNRDMVCVNEFGVARQVLRSDGLRQAGFRAELLERFAGRKHAPVLFQDGEAHRKQRSATARFFAPKVVATRYRKLMEELSRRLVERFRSTGRAELGPVVI
jgi:cytochrome P450